METLNIEIMNCPYCNKEDTSVLESRTLPEGDGLRRRRLCNKCKKRFTTHEKVVNLDIKVIKKSGKIEQYDRNKLYKGILKACFKRNVSDKLIEEMVDEIEIKVLNKKTSEIKSREIGKMVLSRLKKVDDLAYVRFSSVYMDFGDLKDFQKFINDINNSN